ncbi:unnamed protein product [Owenia fusiformis]|uniref:Uncharacterized protein n=1 Tax=Owenia fusiformis TaxID=6347 RepID=A0A8J1XT02_OWEFU|nr:unnamed protein product [Owenia fusiformis]
MFLNSINKLHGSLTILCQRKDSTTEGIALKQEKQYNETVEKKIAVESEKLITFGIQKGLIDAISKFKEEVDKKREFENPQDKNTNAQTTQNVDENKDTIKMVAVKAEGSQLMTIVNPYDKEEDDLYDALGENEKAMETTGIKIKTHQEKDVVKSDSAFDKENNSMHFTSDVTRGAVEPKEVKIEKQQKEEVLKVESELDQTTKSTVDTSEVDMGTVEQTEIKIDTQEEMVQHDSIQDEIYEVPTSPKNKTPEPPIENSSQMKVHKKERGLHERFLHDIMKPKKEATEFDQGGKKVWLGVCKKLLEYGALPHKENSDGVTPYKDVVDEKNEEFDELGALLLTHMPNDEARKIHMRHRDKGGNIQEAEITIEKLLEADMVKTVRALLDCLIDKQPGEEDALIHFDLLDADSNGYTPDEEDDFDYKAKSGLHELTYYGDMDLLYHDAVRLFIDYKWKAFGRSRIIREAVVYIISIFFLTFSVGVACQAPDPLVYDTPLQVTRAVFEVCTIIFVLYHLLSEIKEMTRNKLGYWKSFENFFDLLSICLLLIVIPLRLSAVNAQWYSYALGYICWIMRILKYAPLSRRAGVYVHTLWVIITRDIVRFIILFTIILLAFSGSFQLSLRGEGKLAKLNYTMSVFGYMFIGIRTLVEQQPVIDYTHETNNSNNVLSILIMVLYLSACVIVLLNLLIAQMNNRFNCIQYQCQRDLELSRAKIISRIEQNATFSCYYRSWCYKKTVKNNNYKKELLKWEDPPLDSNERNVQEVRDTVNEIRDCMHHSKADCSIRNLNAQLESMNERMREIEKLLKRQGSTSALRERGVRYQSNSSVC